MTTTTFVNGQTPIVADWLNDANGHVYDEVAHAHNSDNIDFTQAGTGAVTRNAQDKMRESVSVKDFGAVGDGVTDDTAAIQAAIDYCTDLLNRKQTLYFPASNAAMSYKVTAPLTVIGRLNIEGDGIFSTVIQGVGLSANRAIIEFNNPAIDNAYFSSIADINIVGDGVCDGIHINNTPNFNVRTVNVSTVANGLVLSGTVNFTHAYSSLSFHTVSDSSVSFDSFSGGGQFSFYSCTFTGDNGFVVDSAAATDSVALYNCNFEQCVIVDMYVAGNVAGLTLNACRSEGLNGATSILISPTVGNYVRGLSITGCFWQTDFGNADPIMISGDVSGFSITGNYASYAGFLQFVKLDGAGSAGVISGNHCENSPQVVNVPRAGVLIMNNRNAAGMLPEYSGLTPITWEFPSSGIWNPVITSAAGVITQSAAVGNYTKVGKQVNLEFSISMTTDASVGTSNLTITGLPFAAGLTGTATICESSYSSSDFGTGGAWGHAYVIGSEIRVKNRAINISSRAATFVWFFSAAYQVA